MNESATFWDKIAERYAKQPVADEASYQKKLEYTQKLFRPDMEVLELGCGTGSTAITHAPFVRHIRAVDISPEMLRIAKSKADEKGITNIDFECAPIEGFKAPDASVDMVMMHSILHLLEDKEVAIAKVFNMLRPGGWFVSSTSCMSGAMWFLKPVVAIMCFFGKAPKVVQFFSTSQLLDAIRAAGFEIDYQWQPSKTKAMFIVAKKP